MQILHITTHLGGGVGKALSHITAYAQKCSHSYRHKILMLDNPEKMQFVEVCKQNNVEVICTSDIGTIISEINNSDIVQLSWWHHPIMAEFLNNFPQIPMRLIIWSHISGCTYPELPFGFIKQSHKNFFTTKYTFDNPYWNSNEREYAASNSEIIYGAGDLRCQTVSNSDKKDHFVIGYVGTLNYSKLSPNFIDLCSRINIPNTKFVLVGDLDNKEAIEMEAKRRNMVESFEFVGYVEDVYMQLSRFDVFGYPLNPWHFGATENAILEALASGIPVVAINQGAERYIIEHMKTGLLADNEEHYGQLMRYLYENPEERRRIGENGRKYVIENFSLKKTVDKMLRAYDDVMLMEPKVFEFRTVFGDSPYEWFLTCLGADKGIFKDSINQKIMEDETRASDIKNQIQNCRFILKEKSKSSVNHFWRYYPEDIHLNYWNNII